MGHFWVEINSDSLEASFFCLKHQIDSNTCGQSRASPNAYKKCALTIDRIVGGQMVIFAFELPIDPIATPNWTIARHNARLLT